LAEPVLALAEPGLGHPDPAAGVGLLEDGRDLGLARQQPRRLLPHQAAVRLNLDDLPGVVVLAHRPGDPAARTHVGVLDAAWVPGVQLLGVGERLPHALERDRELERLLELVAHEVSSTLG
jgi:hypothetical protein